MTSIVQLAKSLKLSVVAEGIETEDQLQKLNSLGIDFGQGYLLSRPKSAADLIFTRCMPNEKVEAA